MAKLEWGDFIAGIPHEVVRRGYGYVNKVKIVKVEDGIIQARVQGTRLYSVAITQDEEGFTQACTCPYEAPCKHTVALALVILMKPELKKRLEMYPDPLFQHNKINNDWENELEEINPDRQMPLEPINQSMGWLERISESLIEVEQKENDKKPSRIERVLYYVLSVYNADPYRYQDREKYQIAMEVGVAQRERGKEKWELKPTRSPRQIYSSKPQYLTPTDLKLLSILASLTNTGYSSTSWYSVGVDGFAIQEVIKYLRDCPKVYLQLNKPGLKQKLTPLLIREPAAIEIVMQKTKSGWDLVPKVDKIVEIKTIFDYVPCLILTQENELIPLTANFKPELLKTMIEGANIPIAAMADPHTITTLLSLSRHLPLTLPEELMNNVVVGEPVPRVELATITKALWESKLQMNYGRNSISPTDRQREYMSDGDGKIVKRNWEREAEYIKEFEKYRKDYYMLDDVTVLADTLPPNWEIGMEEKVLSRLPGQMNFTSESGIDWLDIGGELVIDEEKFTLAELILSGAGKSRIVELGGHKRWIDNALWEQLNKLDKLADGRGIVQLNRTQVGILDNLDMIETEKLHSEWRRTLQAIKNFAGVAKTKKIKEIKAELRPYQLSGVGFLQYLQELGFGGILADDMGLGKTIQALAMLAQFFAKNKKLKTLIVAPTSVVSNWERETGHFAPQLATLNYTGPARALPQKQFPEIVITNYAILRIDGENLKKEKWDYVILDEAQYAKNVKSKTAGVVRELVATHRLCLTGTPMENNLSELYSQLTFLNPGMLGSLEQFRRNIASPIEKKQDEAASRHLQRLIKPFILRRTKEQVLKDLPPKTEQVITLSMGESQREFYETLRLYYRAKIMKLVEERGVEKSQIQILEALLRLRQACCDPRLIKAKDKSGSVKLAELVRILKELNQEGHKVLVFSQFTSMIALIEKELEKEALPYQILTGQTKTIERRRLMDVFQTSATPLIFLLSLKAGGVGVNLTAASYVIHFDPWWNPAAEAQATDRAHRIGQTKAITVYKLIVENSIEEKVLELQKKKRDLIERVLEGGAVGKKITKDDLEYLLG